MKPPFSSADVAALRDRLADAGPREMLETALDLFGPRLALATSFGPEDMVLLHHAAALKRDAGREVRVFTLDTGRLPEETHALLDRVRLSFALDVEVFFPDTAEVEALIAEKGPFSFYESVEERRRCCHVRKVAPLRRALSTVDAWVTGLRREQAPTRAGLQAVEVDEAHGGILKLSPLAALTEAEVWDFVEAHRVPVNALHDQGVPSIGCAPCTRPVPGWNKGRGDGLVDLRSGRWWWESPAHKECGLHPAR